MEVSRLVDTHEDYKNCNQSDQRQREAYAQLEEKIIHIANAFFAINTISQATNNLDYLYKFESCSERDQRAKLVFPYGDSITGRIGNITGKLIPLTDVETRVSFISKINDPTIKLMHIQRVDYVIDKTEGSCLKSPELRETYKSELISILVNSDDETVLAKAKQSLSEYYRYVSSATRDTDLEVITKHRAARIDKMQSIYWKHPSTRA